MQVFEDFYKTIELKCFQDKYAEAFEDVPNFLAGDWELNLEKFLRLLRFNMGPFQLAFYKMLVEKCADINETDASGQSILHHALKGFRNTFANREEPIPPEENKGDLLIDALLDRPDIDVDLFDYEDRSPLYFACHYTTERIVRALLRMGADINALCGKESTPLTMVACDEEKLDVLNALCDFGADVNVCDDKGSSPLHLVCKNRNVDFVRTLLQNGANVNAADKNADTPLHVLITGQIKQIDRKNSSYGLSVQRRDELLQKNEANAVEIINLLLEAGADIEAANKDMRSPFFLAAIKTDSQMMSKQIPVLKCLLSHGAEINSQDINDYSCLHYAVMNDDINLVKFLLENGADAGIQNNKGETPYKIALDKNRRAIISVIEKSNVRISMDGDDLDAAFMRACKNGRRGVAEMLVKSGNIDVTYVDDEGRTPLHYIAKLGMSALAKFVIDQGVDVNYIDNYGQTALHFAAGHGRKEIFNLLVENGADTNIADDKGVLPIHLTANRGQHDLLEILLKNGGDVTTKTTHGQSLLHVACLTRSRECVRLLLEQGIDPNILDRNGITALVISVNINQKEIVKMLLSSGADIKAKDLDGNEAVHIATLKGFKDMLLLLFENGCDVNALNNRGLAPLHLAAYCGYKDIFKFLLDKGADFELKTGAGKSCIDIAAENGQKELIELIGIIQKRRSL